MCDHVCMDAILWLQVYLTLTLHQYTYYTLAWHQLSIRHAWCNILLHCQEAFVKHAVHEAVLGCFQYPSVCPLRVDIMSLCISQLGLEECALMLQSVGYAVHATHAEVSWLQCYIPVIVDSPYTYKLYSLLVYPHKYIKMEVSILVRQDTVTCQSHDFK